MKQPYWTTDWFLGLLVALVFAVLTFAGVLRGLDWFAYDLGVRFSPAHPANPDVVVVGIDDAALHELGGWPWSRDILAEATKLLVASQPAVIGYAMSFATHQSNSKGLEYIHQIQEVLAENPKRGNATIRRLLRKAESTLDSDQMFARTLSRAGRIVMAVPYHLAESQVKEAPPELDQYLTRYTLKNVISSNKNTTLLNKLTASASLPVADVIYPPIPTLSRYAGAVGLLRLYQGSKQVLRNVPMVVEYGEEYWPSFALMMAARSQGMKGRHVSADLSTQSLQLGSSSIVTDKELRIYPFFYRGKNDKPAFKSYSILDVLNKTVGKRELQNKVVILGLTARQQAAMQETPLGEAMAPAVFNAHVVSSLLNDDMYVVPAWGGIAQIIALALVGLYLMYILPRFRIGTGLAFSIVLFIGLINAHFFLMVGQSTWVPLAVPMVALVLGHIVLGAKHVLQDRVGRVQHELSDSNLMLGQSFQSQGQLDEAFEKYRKCGITDNLLDKLYNLGLDYERKRQYNKGVEVFKYINQSRPGFRDVLERLGRNRKMSNMVVIGGGKAPTANGTMVITDPMVQKPMLGRYQIDRELGRGAMGMVYLGHDEKIGRTVAIKTMTLAQEFEGDKLEDVKNRFFREAETAGRLNHPNIVTIYDVGEDQEMSYIAMDYVKGENLLAYCKAEDRLPVKEVFEVIIQVAEALDFAHTANVVHRDIKPANILYDREDGVLKVTDFGVACLTDTSKTKTGTILGSPSYMSPEQLAGKKVDGRSDLFSLGITFYQMLTGELPFIGESLASLMYKITNEKHPDVRMFRPDLPSCVSKLINKALHKELDRRFQSGEKMATAMRRCLERIEE